MTTTLPKPPTVGKEYFYLRDNMVSHAFTVHSKTWSGYDNDYMRLAKGNVYRTEKQANKACNELNMLLAMLKNQSVINP